MNLNTLLLGMPGALEWVLIILGILLLFGGKKIPELMKGLGQGMKEFKKASKNDDGDNEIQDNGKNIIDK